MVNHLLTDLSWWFLMPWSLTWRKGLNLDFAFSGSFCWAAYISRRNWVGLSDPATSIGELCWRWFHHREWACHRDSSTDSLLHDAGCSGTSLRPLWKCCSKIAGWRHCSSWPSWYWSRWRRLGSCLSCRASKSWSSPCTLTHRRPHLDRCRSLNLEQSGLFLGAIFGEEHTWSPSRRGCRRGRTDATVPKGSAQNCKHPWQSSARWSSWATAVPQEPTRPRQSCNQRTYSRMSSSRMSRDRRGVSWPKRWRRQASWYPQTHYVTSNVRDA